MSALAGQTITGVRRIGKMPVVDVGELSLLIHLMSAGRLQLWDKRASLRDKASRLLIRVDGDRELRLREFGTQQRAWAKLLPAGAVEDDDAVATLGPEAWPAPDPEVFAELIRQPRHLHPLLRDQRVIAGIGRSWVDEILWEARLSPFQRGSELDDDAVDRLRLTRGAGAGPRARPLRAGDRRHRSGQAADAAAGAPARRRAVPALRQRRSQSVHYKDYVMTYCPEEQTGGKVYKDRRLSRLLK